MRIFFNIFISILFAILLSSCTGNERPTDDLGAFLPTDSGLDHDDIFIGDSGAIWTQFCKANEGGNPRRLLVAGQVVELTPENQYGSPFSGVTVDFYDYCSQKVASAVSGVDGTFAFYLEVGQNGFDGYAEYTRPEDPRECTPPDCKHEGYPVFRQFDKRYHGDIVATIYWLVAGLLFEAPLNILGQNGKLGFIQGSIYNLVGGKEVAGAVFETSSGIVTYLSDTLPVPDPKLTETQSRGVFFVYNAMPGQVMLTASLPDGRIIEKPVIVWAVDSHPRKTITVVGIPVYPGLDVTLPDG